MGAWPSLTYSARVGGRGGLPQLFSHFSSGSCRCCRRAGLRAWELRATIGHGLAYALLAALAVLGQRQPRIAATLAGVIGYGVILEVLQGAFGLRTFQWTDIAANALGALVGVLSVILVRRSLIR